MNELMIYGDIGWDNNAKDIESQLKDFGGDPIKVRINSGGGDVYEGVAILNSLRAYEGELTIVVESLAASAASFIAVGAGGKVVIRPNAELMIHKAWTMLAGNADDIDKAKADLARQDVKIAQVYAERAGGELDDWLGRMSAETWYSAQEAVDAGLVDEIEDAKAPAAAASNAAVGTKVFAQFRYGGRSAAPPPTLGARSESAPHNSTTKGDTRMGILNQLADELGKSPEEVQNALSGFFNETVTVSGEVEVNYPADTPIAPTERVTIEPVIGDTPVESETSEESTVENSGATAGAQNAVADAAALGLTFALGTVPEGWVVKVDETTGVVTVKAPSGVEVGETVELTVKVNDSTDVPVTLKIRSLSDDGEDTAGTQEEETLTPAAASMSADVVTVPRAVWDEYVADRQRFAAQLEQEKRRELEKKIDGHIRDGRYSASHRGAALAAYEQDPVAAEKIWGSLPKNKAVPVKEIGHSTTDGVLAKADELLAKANANRQTKKKEK